MPKKRPDPGDDEKPISLGPVELLRSRPGSQSGQYTERTGRGVQRKSAKKKATKRSPQKAVKRAVKKK